MNGFTRNFAGVVHPNAAIARRELERQERSRLRRLSEVRPTPQSTASHNASTSSRSRIRPSSAGRWSRPSSRSGPLSGQRHCDEQFESLKSRVSSPERPSSAGGRRSRSDTTGRMRTSFLLSPQRRWENAQAELQVSTEEQARALQEELQSWYFSNGEDFAAGAEFLANDLFAQTGASAASGSSNSSPGAWVVGHPSAAVEARPAVDALEEAAAAVKAKVSASHAFGPPPPLPGGVGIGERAALAPGRGVSGGCRGVAAATANRQVLAR